MLDNVNSKYIIEEIVGKLKNKRKLKIIKYNKRLLSRLNINKKNFELYAKLKEFNDKYKTKINDIDNTELNIRGKYIGDKGSIDLFDLGFKNLIKLDMKL